MNEQQRLRVLHLIPTLEGGGAERQLVLIANAQARAGHHIHIGLVRLGPHAQRIDSGIRVYQGPAIGHYDLRLLAWARALVQSVRPDILHTWLPMMDVVGGLAAKTTGTPWVLAEQASGPAYRDRWQDRIVRRAIGRLADGVVANSSAGLAYWTVTSARPRIRQAIRNAVDLDAIRAAPSAAAWPAPGAAHPRILFAGRLTAQKDVPTLIRALALLRERRPFSALVLGEGPDASTLQALASRHELNGVVAFGGYRDDLWSVMKWATVLVNPSLFEGQPNVVLEALACGVPVVASDIAEHREFLDASTAILVAPGDPKALADALEDVICSPHSAGARTDTARSRIESHRPEAIASEYDALYAAALEGH